MKTRFIVNPVAGDGRGKQAFEALRPSLEERLGSLDVEYTSGPKMATDVARRALEQGCRRLVVFGGDGTFFEVVNGVAGSEVVLAMIPCGTGNDFARSLGLPRAPREAIRVALDGVPRRVDLGRWDRGYFLNVAGVGFDAEVTREANRASKMLGRLGSTLPFVLMVLKMLSSWHNAPIRVKMDDQVVEGKMVLVAVGNGKFYGGGMKITPGAAVDDGWFEVVVAGDMTRLEILGALLRVYKGTHVLLPKVSCYRARRVEISSPVPLSLQTDGEVVAQVPVTLEVAPGVIQVMVPLSGPA